MKKEYQSTIEDAVEARFRLAELNGTVQKLKWIGPIAFLAILIYLFLLLDNLVAKLIISGAAAVLLIPYHLSTYKKDYRKRIRKTLVKALETDQPVPSEFEIDESGLVWRKLGVEIRFSWANVQKINHTDDSIEVIMKPIGLAIIPKRIFEETEELQEWIKFIEVHKG
jgi:hypothetical protein